LAEVTVGVAQLLVVRPHHTRMKFKHSYWLMIISLGCSLLGFIGWILLTPASGGGHDWRIWLLTCSSFLIGFGVIGFISALLWMIVTGFRKD
jgi:hypothetical protein